MDPDRRRRRAAGVRSDAFRGVRLMAPHPEMTPLPITADGADAFEPVWKVFEAEVIAQAEALTNSPMDRDDLIQEARCKLLELDPTGIDVERPSNVEHVRTELRRR